MTIKTRNIADGAVTSAKLAAGAANAAAIGLNTITGAQLAGQAAAVANGGATMALRVAVVRYNFAVDGGATPVTPAVNVTLPAGAVVLGGAVHGDPAGAVTAAGAATVSIGTSAGSGVASILAVTGKASFANDAVIINTATATPFVMTAAGTVVLTIATGPLTAGIFDVIIFYALGVSVT